MKKYIKQKSFSPIEARLNHVVVVQKNSLPDNVSLNSVLAKIDKRIPTSFYSNLDSIYIGEFKDLIDREINAMYSDGALYISNAQDDENDMIDDIVHEIAHAVEDEHRSQIYSDGKIEFPDDFPEEKKSLFTRMYKTFFTLDFEPDYYENYEEAYNNKSIKPNVGGKKSFRAYNKFLIKQLPKDEQYKEWIRNFNSRKLIDREYETMSTLIP